MAGVIVTRACLSYGDVKALRDVDLDIQPGELFVVLGPSGCGKTTLLRALSGLEALDAGGIEIGGQVVSSAQVHAAPETRGVGFVFQDLALWPHMTVAEHLDFVLGAASGSGTRTRDTLEDLGIGHLCDRRPDELSGGERQRLALARAIVNDPALLLLDEPLSSLDPSTAREIRRVLARLNRERGVTMVYVTHLQEEAFELADRIAVLRAGRVEQVGVPEEIVDRPATHFVASFVGANNVLEGSVEGGNFHCALGSFPVTEATEAAVFRESDLEVVDSGIGGVVVSSAFRGEYFVTLVRVDDVEIRVRDDRRRESGDALQVAYNGTPWFGGPEDSP